MKNSIPFTSLFLFSQIVVGCISGGDDNGTQRKVEEIESRLNILEQKLDSVNTSAVCPLHGWVRETDPSGNTLGNPIAGARVVFTSEDSTFRDTVYSSQYGRFNARLPFDRYYARAEGIGFKTSDSYPGFYVCWTDTLQVGNFFLTKE